MKSTLFDKLFRLLALLSSIALLAACNGESSEAPVSNETSVSEAPSQELSYVGSDTCLTCHGNKDSFLTSGHNFKLMKIEDGEAPQYPYSNFVEKLEDVAMDVTNPAGVTSWDDVSYVIGGFMKVGVLIDKDGYVVDGPGAIVKIDQIGGGVIPHHTNWHTDDIYTEFLADPPRVKPDPSLDYYTLGSNGEKYPLYNEYYCGNCHTTGWQAYTKKDGDDRNLNRQDDLPGMGGTFAMAGIQCEACHGAGSAHVEAPSKTSIFKIAAGRTKADLDSEGMGYGKAITCAECHTLGGEKYYKNDYLSAYNVLFDNEDLSGLIERGNRTARAGRRAADGLMGIDPDTGEVTGPHSGLSCQTCHDPHKSRKYQDEPEHLGAMVKACTDCHSSVEFAGSDIAQAAHVNKASCTDCHMPSNAHLFAIDLSAPSDDAHHYSADDMYDKPWARAADSCKTCHADDYDERAAKIGKIHL